MMSAPVKPYKEKKGNGIMKATFYDLKTRKKVELEVTGKKDMSKPGRKSFALKAVSEDGRPLTTFVNEETFKSAAVPVIE